MDSTLTGSSVAKQLASCNKTTRERALRLLQSWLSSHSTTSSSAVSDDDLLKIWKGLFYCVWHADKLPVQVDLINRLASLVSDDLPLYIRYLEAFLSTIRREWSGIDQLRLDKFYLLIRRFLHQFFQVLSMNSWDLDFSTRMIEILSGKSLLVVDSYSAQGVNYHIAEIFLDEIKEFLPAPPATLDVLLKPFFTVLEKSSDKVLVNKIKSNVFDRLLDNGVKCLNFARAGEDVNPSDDVEKFGKITFALGISEKLFDSASSSDTVQGNRKVLFSLHEGFQKLQKDLEKSGVHIASPKKATEPQSLETNEQAEVDLENSHGEIKENPSQKRKKSKKALSVRVPFPQENGDSIKATEPLILESKEQAEVYLENGNGETNEKPTLKRKKSKKAFSDHEKKSKTKKNELSALLTEDTMFQLTIVNGHHSSVENLEGDIMENRAKKLLDGGRKKTLGNKKEVSDSVPEYSLSSPTKDNNVREEETLNVDIVENGNLISFNEEFVSNLQMQFEKVAAEAGMPINSVQSNVTPVTSIPKKRKRMKSTGKTTSPIGISRSTSEKSEEKSFKKVRFCMKSNLVWKPQSPLPPQTLRLPPSVTPRGSALKKGIPPGPIRETSSSTKKKKLKAMKKARKVTKSVFPAVKRLRKLRSVSV